MYFHCSHFYKTAAGGGFIVANKMNMIVNLQKLHALNLELAKK